MSVIINSSVEGTASHESSLTTSPLQVSTPSYTYSSNNFSISQITNLQSILDTKLNDTLGSIGVNVTANGTDLNLLTGTALYGLTTADLEKLADVDATAVELNYLSGVTGPIQAQIDSSFSADDFTSMDQIILSTGVGMHTVERLIDVLNGTVGIGYDYNDLRAPVAPVDVNAQVITNAADPVASQDVATKNYVDTVAIGGVFLPLSGGTMSGTLNVNGQLLTLDADGDTFISGAIDDVITMETGNGSPVVIDGATVNANSRTVSSVADPVNPQDAVTLASLTATITGLGSTFLSLTGGTMTGGIDMNGNAVSNVLDPVNPQDAVTLASLNAAITNFNSQSVLVDGTNAMTANLNMGGFNFINVSAPVAGTDVGTRDYNDTRYLQGSNDLSDLADITVAKTNLQLSTVATSGDYDDLINTPSGTAVLDDLTNVNVGTPTALEDGFNLVWDNTAGEYTLSAASVLSVFGRTGTIVSAPGDYTASDITNVPSGSIAATDLQSAIDGLDADKVSVDGSIAMSDNLDLGGNRVTNVADPVDPQDVVTLNHLSNELSTSISGFLDLTGTGTMTGTLNMGSNRIEAVTDPVNPQDAVTLGYLEGLGINRILGSVTGVDFQTVGNTPVYTVPVGKMHIITKVIVVLSSYSPGVAPTMPVVSVGISGPQFNQIVSGVTVDPGIGGAADQAIYSDPKDGAATPNAGGTISIQVDNTAGGTISAYTGTVYIMGVEL